MPIALPAARSYGAEVRRLLPVFICLALSGVLPGSAAAGESSSCPSYKFKVNGIPWAGKQIRTRNESCATARRLIRAYAKPRNCRFIAPCRILRYRCVTTDTRGSTFRETCTRGKRRVSWNGSYVSS